ncbi:hypothetical protein [Dactylosporangium sp. NPDC049140]|uniref:DUF6910 family protein n=1 Tax=Dactylosporangium sp. NPDC049140 TaxID=3155647 RepID=UPI0033EE22AB
MRIEVEHEALLRFGTGSPVRAASAIAPLGDGWLVAQDDATHAAWDRPGGTTPVRVLPAVDGHEVFSSSAGTKHLKPDFEAACQIQVDDLVGVLLLGSGSTRARMRSSFVTLATQGPTFVVADLAGLYDAVADALDMPAGQLNLEGACRHGDRLRWFQRGSADTATPSASVEVDVHELLLAATGRIRPDAVTVDGTRRYQLGTVRGIPLAVTDAAALPDGRILVSAAAEDTPNPVDDGPVVAAALALLDDDRVQAVTPLPHRGDAVQKIEGLALHTVERSGARLLGVVDADDPATPSTLLHLRVFW